MMSDPHNQALSDVAASEENSLEGIAGTVASSQVKDQDAQHNLEQSVTQDASVTPSLLSADDIEEQEVGKDVDEAGFPLPERQHKGMHYLDVISRIDTILKPGNYLEIGTHDGASLKRVTCPSISIDPRYVINSDIIGTKPQCHIFQMTSDHFFEAHDPKRFFGNSVKLAFLDGMHRFEFLLRDFINVEKHCVKNSVILLHDCFPLNVLMTERVYDGVSRPGFDKVKSKEDLKRPAFWWTGDVWKVLWILKKYRPELVNLHMNAAPTGLVAITGLDPQSTVLSDNYFKIVHEFGSIILDEKLLNEHYEKFNLIEAGNLASESQLTRCFWF